MCVILVFNAQDPVFEKAAFDAPVGQVVRAKTRFGLHLLRVVDERCAHNPGVALNAQRYSHIGSLTAPLSWAAVQQLCVVCISRMCMRASTRSA